MGDIIPMKDLGLSKELLAGFDPADDSLFSGVEGGYAVLGYRGKVWRIKYQGDEVKVRNADGDPAAAVRVIILGANPNMSKIFYAKNYQEGDSGKPDCWSTDGKTPDSGVPDPQASHCATCPQNQFGSRVTDAGKEIKACGDSRRLAVVPAGDTENSTYGGPMLLRVSGKSARETLKAYGLLLRNNSVPMYAVVTKITFDDDTSYPKLEFEVDVPATRALKGDAVKWILAHKDSEETKRILSVQDEHTEVPRIEASQAVMQAEAKAPQARPKPAPKPVAKPKPKVAPKPVAEDDDDGFGGNDPDAVAIKEVNPDDDLGDMLGDLLK